MSTLTAEVCDQIQTLRDHLAANGNRARKLARSAHLLPGSVMCEELHTLANEYSVLLAEANTVQASIAALRMTGQVRGARFRDAQCAAANDQTHES